jgi:putative flippase GtrA
MPALEPAESPAPARGGLLGLLGRHQLASILSTAVDFGVMVLVVELLGRSPVVGTLAGAACGAITNFQLGRRWIFDAQHEGAAPQALRYSVVSGGSAALNALGEYLAHDVLGIYYLAARALVAVTVSFAWNFPMQRHFVFRRPRISDKQSA